MHNSYSVPLSTASISFPLKHNSNPVIRKRTILVVGRCRFEPDGDYRVDTILTSKVEEATIRVNGSMRREKFDPKLCDKVKI